MQASLMAITSVRGQVAATMRRVCNISDGEFSG